LRREKSKVGKHLKRRAKGGRVSLELKLKRLNFKISHKETYREGTGADGLEKEKPGNLQMHPKKTLS